MNQWIASITTSERRRPHLLPHELPKAIHARFMEAQVEWANEHSEKVGLHVGIGYCVGGQGRHPHSMELGIGISLKGP
jgi:hypothetical protein